jgi:hypothetical protein
VNQDLYDAGLATRRRVLGDADVDASLAAATEFFAAMDAEAQAATGAAQ